MAVGIRLSDFLRVSYYDSFREFLESQNAQDILFGCPVPKALPVFM